MNHSSGKEEYEIHVQKLKSKIKSMNSKDCLSLNNKYSEETKG